jgi:hypothetical protein
VLLRKDIKTINAMDFVLGFWLNHLPCGSRRVARLRDPVVLFIPLVFQSFFIVLTE